MSMLTNVRETMRRDEVWSFMAPPPSLDLDVSHGPILYLEELNVSFDGFKAINDLTLYIDAGELLVGRPEGLRPGLQALPHPGEKAVLVHPQVSRFRQRSRKLARAGAGKSRIPVQPPRNGGRHQPSRANGLAARDASREARR